MLRSQIVPRRPGTRLIAYVLLAVVAMLGPAGPAAGGNPRPVKTMTMNMYLGADLAPALAARTLPELLAGAAAVYRMVQSTDFPARARALAREIAGAHPDVVGLQEAALWRIGEPGVLDGPATPATTVTYDYLALLRSELASLGMRYEVAITRVDFDAEVPTALRYDVRLTQRQGVLVRSDADGEVEVMATDKGTYGANLSLPVAGLGSIALARGWTSADVIINRRPLRVLNTHLEPLHPGIRSAQSAELLAGPASANLPVVLLGDLNSGPSDAAPGAYAKLLAGGFDDAWTSTNGDDPGFTCCQAEDLRNTTSRLDQRIDLVLFDSGSAVRARRYGVDADARTPSGLWPSDHAAVVATLQP